MQRMMSLIKIALPAAAVLIILVCCAWVADRAVSPLRAEVESRIREHTGIRCEIGDLEYAFPIGLRALEVQAFQEDGRPWFRAQAMTVRLHPLRILTGPRTPSNLITAIDLKGVEVTLERPVQSFSLPTETADPAFPARIVPPTWIHPLNVEVRDIKLNVQTGKNRISRHYDRLSARLDGPREAVHLEVRGPGESLSLTFRNQPEGRIEIKAPAVCLAPLAAIWTLPIDLGNTWMEIQAEAVRQEDGAIAFTARGQVRESGGPPEAAAGIAPAAYQVQGVKRGDQVEIQAGRLQFWGEPVLIRGSVTLAEKPVLDAVLTFDNLSLGQVARAIPKALHPRLTDLQVEGTLDGTFTLSVDTARPRSLRYRFQGRSDPLRVVSLGPAIDIPALNRPFHHAVRRPGRSPLAIQVGPGNPSFIPYGEIPPALIAAVLTAEDGRFFSHAGFSPRHIHESLMDNLRAGRIVRGASTITMQLAKNLYLTPERTLSRKMEEFFITVALEQQLSKRRILEIYLNIIEWGKDLYGVGAASQYYFRKDPRRLTPIESAFLASIIACPGRNWKRDPLATIGEGWWSYLHLILVKMHERGALTVEDLRNAGVPPDRIPSQDGLFEGLPVEEGVLAPPDREAA